MRHDDYKLIVDGVELENPGLRILGGWVLCFLLGFLVGLIF